MQMKVFAVYDQKAEVFAQPMYLLTVGQAERALGDEARRVAPDNALANHPADFVLYELGTWDNTTADFELHPQPRLIARVDSLIQQA